MAAEQPNPDISVQALVERAGFCERCVRARALAQEIVVASRLVEQVDPGQTIERYLGFVGLCPRREPIPSNSETCSVLDPKRGCLHPDLGALYGVEKVEKVTELLGVKSVS